MQSHQLNVKIYAERAPESAELIPILHNWIKEDRLDEVLIDVADYGHVKDGPGVLLVAHEAHYGIDFTDGSVGLLYGRKRGVPAEDLEERIVDAIRRALVAANELEGEAELEGKVRFRGDELWFRILDRLHAPNVDATYEAVEPALRRVVERLYGDAEVTLDREPEPRRPFAVRIKASEAPDVATLLGRIAAA